MGNKKRKKEQNQWAESECAILPAANVFYEPRLRAAAITVRPSDTFD